MTAQVLPDAKPLLDKQVPGPGMGRGPGQGRGCFKLLDLFDRDIDAVHDFMDSCDEHEKSIIESTDDPKVLIQVITIVQDDLEETSKDLAMDD